MPTPATAYDRFCDVSYAATHPSRTLPIAAPQVQPSLDECGRCLHRWSEHEVAIDSWGEEYRVCPEEDWLDTDRELAWRRQQAGELR